MTPRRWVFWALLFLMGIYEVYAIATPASGDTISEMVWGLARFPIVPFVFGLLSGHFFWRE